MSFDDAAGVKPVQPQIVQNLVKEVQLRQMNCSI